MDPERHATRAVRVLSNRPLRPGSWLLTVERTGDFTPGQCVGLCVEESTPPRSYSIASGLLDPHFEILYDVVPGGALTPLLSRLCPGDTVRATPPFGSFRDQPGPAVWVSTGTGVAPFVSMARSADGVGKTLIHGSRRSDGLYFRALLAQRLGPRYLPCLSRQDEPGTYRGRVTAYLADCPLVNEARYLLCGSAEMVVDTRDILIGRGVPYTRILSEVYF